MAKQRTKRNLVCKCYSDGKLEMLDKKVEEKKPHIKIFGKLMAISELELATFKHEFEIFYV